MHISPQTIDLRPIRGLCTPVGASPLHSSDVPDLSTLRPVVIRAGRDEEIFAQDTRADHCYLVVSGCLRTVRLLEDGRRQVGEFLFAGEILGWDSLERHDFSAEAVTKVVLHRVNRESMERLADRDPAFARRMRTLSAQKRHAEREHLVRLGRKTAPERIASFLLEMSQRIEHEGGPWIELPMARGDIADYLGLTVETVCRQLTSLRHQGTITVQGTRVAIRDRRLLEASECQGALN
jgi:CRP-like cAMP-binding protein